MDQEKIGKYIACKRKAAGLTQEQLAEKLGKSGKAVSKWERGVCLPDVSVYTELCDILGITLNEFFAGENIEPAYIEIQSEKNLLGVATEGNNRSSRLKRIVLLTTAVALVLAAVLGWVLSREGFFLSNYIKPYDKESSEYRAATALIVPDEACMYHYSVDRRFKRMTISVYEFEGGRTSGGPVEMTDEFSDDGGPSKHEGVIAVINDFSNGSLSLVSNTENSRIKSDTPIGSDIMDPDEYNMSSSEAGLIKNVEPDTEYPMTAYFYGNGDVSGVPVDIAWSQAADNPSGSDYCVIVTVRFES